MLPFIALLYCVAFSEAFVEFKNAIIFDAYDLQGVEQTNIAQCNIGGCSIFVSAPQQNLEATKNIFIYGHTSQSNQSLYKFATEYDATTSTKIGMRLADTAISILNYNKNNKIGSLVIYVIGAQDQTYQSDQVEVFDAFNINNRPARNKKMTMIMSAEPFNLHVQAAAGNLQAFVRATGPDNNYGRDSPHNCRIIYDHNAAKPFRLRINSPVITINFDGLSNYQICTNMDNYNGAALDYPGMATSLGYVGCELNQFQVYRSSDYVSDVFTLKDSTNTDRDVELNYVVNTKNSDKLDITAVYQGGTTPISETGDGKTPKTLPVKAQKINLLFTNAYGSSYWLGYTPKSGVMSNPSSQGICPEFPPTSATGSTQPTPTTTTSASNDLLTLLTSAVVCLFARQF